MLECNVYNLLTNIVTMLREHWVHVRVIHNQGTALPSDHPLYQRWTKISWLGPKSRTLPPFPTRPEHIAYLSNYQDGYMAYMDSKWYTGTHKTMRIGKYLAKYTALDNETIKKLVAKCQQFTIEWREDIVDAYIESAEECSACESCMSHVPSYYSSPFHPMGVMETGPFKVALLRDIMGRIVSRALCCTETMTFPMIYGHHALADKLYALGYEHGDFEGVSVETREYNGSIVLPYVDGHRVLGDRSRHCAMEFDYDGDGTVTFSNRGDYTADQTNGLYEIEERRECDCCRDSYHEDDMHYTHEDEHVCVDCISRYYVTAYDEWGDEVLAHEDNCFEAPSDGYWFTSRRAAERMDYYEAEGRDEFYHIDDIVLCDHRNECYHLDDVDAVVPTEDGVFAVIDGCLDGLCVDHLGDLRISCGVSITVQAERMTEEAFTEFVCGDVCVIIDLLEFSENLELLEV